MTEERLEKLSQEFTDKHFTEDALHLLNDPYDVAKTYFSQMLVRFAKHVLASQWVSPDERLPEDKEHIIICYQSFHKGRYLTLYMTDTYEKESGFNGGWIKPEQVIAWMRIPPLTSKREI